MGSIYVDRHATVTGLRPRIDSAATTVSTRSQGGTRRKHRLILSAAALAEFKDSLRSFSYWKLFGNLSIYFVATLAIPIGIYLIPVADPFGSYDENYIFAYVTLPLVMLAGLLMVRYACLHFLSSSRPSRQPRLSASPALTPSRHALGRGTSWCSKCPSAVRP